MLALELRELEIDSKYISNPRIRTVAFLRAVGHEGRTFLQSVGFNMRESSYEKAFALLDDRTAMVEKKTFLLKQKS